MKQGFTRSMAFLHSWCGLLFGWILFSMFLAGAISVFWKEITIWATPELHARPAVTREQALLLAMRTLQQQAPDARSWRITLPAERDPVLQLSWRTANGELVTRRLEPNSGELVRATEGGRMFTRYHFRLAVDRRKSSLGTWAVGLASVAMLVAIVTGVLIHKRLLRDLFVFRPGGQSRRAWLDAHNVLGVLALPFHVVIICTGLAVNYWIYMPAGIDTLYGGDAPAYRADVGQGPGRTSVRDTAAGAPADNLALEELIVRAELVLGAGGVTAVIAGNPGRANAIYEFRGRRDDRISQQADRVVLDGVTGTVIETVMQRPPMFATQSVLVGIHYVLFGGTPLRWLYFFCALAGAGAIATGTVLFVRKRQARAQGGAMTTFLRIAERMTVASIAGPMLASIAFMWGTRLVPATLPDRPWWEVATFFGGFCFAALYALLRLPRRAWIELLSLTALLAIALPLSAVFVPSGSLKTTIAHGDWATAGVDLGAISMGAIVAFVAYLQHRRDREAIAIDPLAAAVL